MRTDGRVRRRHAGDDRRRDAACACRGLLLLLALAASPTGPIVASGLLPERVNQLILYTEAPGPPPGFRLVFSARPITELLEVAGGTIGVDQLEALEGRRDAVVVRVGGKPPRSGTRYDYFFGSRWDADRPWNDGTWFHWRRWAEHSDEVWDHLAILPGPHAERQSPVTIGHVVLRRGGMLLLDTRQDRSVPNGRPFSVRLPEIPLTASGGRLAVLDLATLMARFRDAYYELDGDPLLTYAYSDLAQTEARKYAGDDEAWCSEFASHVYRRFGLETPDPRARQLGWAAMKRYFQRRGVVHPLREVARWSDAERRQRVPPGALISVVTPSGEPHTILLTTWVVKPTTGPAFAGISGANRGMVWAHRRVPLPRPGRFQDMDEGALDRYDRRNFVAVPAAR